MRLGIGEVEVAWRNVAAGTVGGRCVAFAGRAEARSVGVGGHSGEAACVAVGRRCMASTVAPPGVVAIGLDSKLCAQI